MKVRIIFFIETFIIVLSDHCKIYNIIYDIYKSHNINSLNFINVTLLK